MQVDLVFMVDGKDMCAFTGLSAHDENCWCKRNVGQDEFLEANYMVLAQC